MPRTAADAGQIKLGWPDRGIDTSVPYDRQPADTTVAGVNVRAQDPILHRDRGGSRAGLSRWIDEQPAGATDVQMLGCVVYFDAASLLSQAEQDGLVGNPGALVTDTSSNNYPDGPGPNGPGGNAQGGPTGQPGFNNRTITPTGGTRKRPGKGSGIVPFRQTGPSPPPPSPPAPFTRTYTPYTEFLGGEFLPVFSVGPFTLPLTPPTDLAPNVTISGSDACGLLMLADLASWGGTSLPTLAEINTLVLSHGCLYGPPGEAGPYSTITDS